MTSYNLSSFAGAGAQFFDDNGVPLAGGKVFTYAAGTTTPLATYTTAAGTVANTNPIILDAAGRTPNEIWLAVGTLYKFIVKTSTDVLIGTYDGLPPINDPYSINALLGSITGTNAIAAVATPAITEYAAGATYSFIAANTNTAATTISIDGLPVKSITKNGSAPLTAGDIQAGKLTWIEYDGTTFQLLNNIIYGGSITNGTINSLTAPLSPASGGTGRSTLTANNVLLGNGVAAVQQVAPGAAGNVLASNGTTWASAAPVVLAPTAIGQVPFSTDGTTYTATQKITLATSVTPSGTAVDFTGIPAWVNRITIMYASVTYATGTLRVQLGTVGPVYVSSGYVGAAGFFVSGSSTQNAVAYSSAFVASLNTAAISGAIVLTKITGNTWAAVVTCTNSSNSYGLGSGYIALADVLVALRVSTTTSATFTGGTLNISYE